MNLRGLLALSFVAAACRGGGDEPLDDAIDGETPEPAEPTADTAAPGADLTGHVGSIVIGHWPADAYYSKPASFAYGLFVDDDGGVANLAACLLVGGPCVESYPPPGSTVEPTVDLSFVYYAQFFDAGASITAGGVDLRRDLRAGVPLYVGSPTGFPHGSPGSLTVDGDLAPFDEEGVFTYAAPMELLTPDPLQAVDLGADGVVELTWTPGGPGEVYLEHGLALTHLDDDGAHEIPVDDLGLEPPFDSTLLVVSRLTHDEVDAAGNKIKVQTRSDQWLYVEYEDREGWTELAAGQVGETCADATALGSVVAGQYYGDTSASASDHDLGYNTFTNYPTAGREVVVPIALAPAETLIATYRQADYDGSLYLLDARCDVAAPLDGVDVTLTGEAETLSYTAAADEVVYLVLDTWDAELGGRYSLVLDIQ